MFNYLLQTLEFLPDIEHPLIQEWRRVESQGEEERGGFMSITPILRGFMPCLAPQGVKHYYLSRCHSDKGM